MAAVFFELVLRVEIDTSLEEDPAIAASDAMKFAWRQMLNSDQRMRAAFGARLVGAQARRADSGCDIGCPNAPVVGQEDTPKVVAA